VVRSYTVVIVVALTGCGRVNFTQTGDSGAATDDDVAAATSCSTVVAPPIRRYSFDTPAIVDSASGQDGTIVNSPTFVPGKFGMAMQLDGVGARASIPNFLVLDYSVSFWVKTQQIAPGGPTDWWFMGQSIVDGDLCGNPPNGDWGISLINGGRISGAFAGPSPAMVNDNQWHSVLFTRTGADDTLALFVDGVASGTADANSDGLIHDGQAFIGIGAGPCNFNVGPYFKGAIDELVVYDRVLNATNAIALQTCTP